MINLLITGLKKIKQVFYRVYSDYFMPSRLSEYEVLLKEALCQGYEVHSIISFWDLIETKGLKDKQKYLILRHDIDTDVETAKAMWMIEQHLGVKASYYFRLTTLNVPLMQLIHGSGSEASYHFEEIATFCKQNGLKNNEEVFKSITHIRDKFRTNYLLVKEKTSLPLKTVAAHGDFVNRKMGLPNEEILKDENLRGELGIELEVYDEAVMKYITSRCSDTHAPAYWKPYDPLCFLQRNEPIVYILTHPRHWRKNVMENTLDNIRRLWEGVYYQLGVGRFRSKD